MPYSGSGKRHLQTGKHLTQAGSALCSIDLVYTGKDMDDWYYINNKYMFSDTGWNNKAKGKHMKHTWAVPIDPIKIGHDLTLFCYNCEYVQHNDQRSRCSCALGEGDETDIIVEVEGDRGALVVHEDPKNKASKVQQLHGVQGTAAAVELHEEDAR
ncbi:hypothetical protein K7X08_035714 [Anisodus acutangulus]|uniref:Uncharacterized protein n=1 Tax=Anisodus acutangulus TaxID=402998 RepID=A0A9Q1M307_9SOLA|nr:hypothetical protein K7X08_035714 [Anisodus acutangulus]